MRSRYKTLAVTTLSIAGLAALQAVPATAAPATHRAVRPTAAAAAAAGATVHTVTVPGGVIHLSADGVAQLVAKDGTITSTKQLPVTPGKTALSASLLPSDSVVRRLMSTPAVAQSIVAVLAAGTSVTGAPVTSKVAGTRAAATSNAAVNATLRKFGASTTHPLLSDLDSATTTQIAQSARAQLGAGAVDLSRAVVMQVTGDPAAAAAALEATGGVTFAEANQTVSAFDTGAVARPAVAPMVATPKVTPASGLPTNYALTSSMSSFLNAQGVNAAGAFATLAQRYHQLPGTGERITNVSIGDLTDQAMADAGDGYVQTYGPTTVVQNGQRFLDLPSMPLIPTYVTTNNGGLSSTGTTEGQDPTLDEVLLDFGVMAPLPHDQQRAGSVGTGATDLLGIAPGASYRLVIPQTPTFDEVNVALLAAARQTPKPDVITASLGFGTDAQGFPARYLEDDPIEQAVIAAIVKGYGITVSISSNDGTRLYTPAAVGPDGGSTPTDVTTSPADTTQIDDDAFSTTPSKVLDSGAIAVGATTLDDTMTETGKTGSTNGVFATTRTNGSGAYSSGFGSRVNVSAPGDGIAVFGHAVGGSAKDVTPALNGGTSASAPMVAAAAAVALQTARLTGQTLTPAGVRSLLEKTGHAVATPPQIDQPLNVGNRIDVSAAVDSLLQTGHVPAIVKTTTPSIVRVSVAHRITIGGIGGQFTEDTDPGRLDLSGDAADGTTGSGQGLVGPVSFGLDTVNLNRAIPTTYRMIIGKKVYTSATATIRITPKQILAAAGLPVVSKTDRTATYTLQILQRGAVVAATTRPIVLGPSDGTFDEAPAPVAPPTVAAGKPVTVSYDLRGVRDVESPRLVVSTSGHWSPTAGPVFSPAYQVNLTALHGTVTIPASAFDGGGGIYGIGIAQISSGDSFAFNIYAEFSSIRVIGPAEDAGRPAAPLLTDSSDTGHDATVTRTAPNLGLKYDVSTVRGARSAAYEVSAPAPNAYGSFNTVTNANGTQEDHDGVNSGSVRFTKLSGTKGSVTIDTRTLGLDAVGYNIRVVALDGSGKVLGQASPTSYLDDEDGVAPGGGYVTSFDAVSGTDSLAAVRTSATNESVFAFDPATGTYGAELTADTVGGGYQVLGVDTTLHAALLMHYSPTGATSSLETWSTLTDSLVKSVVLDDTYLPLGGQVDVARHRGEVLARSQVDNSDALLTIDLHTGAMATPIPADTGTTKAGAFDRLDIDAKTGDVLLSPTRGGSICFLGATATDRIDPATGTIAVGTGASCVRATAMVPSKQSLLQLSYKSFSLNFAGTTSVTAFSTKTLTASAPLPLRAEPPTLMVADDNVALVGYSLPLGVPRFGSPYGIITDNNATSQLAEVNPTTGAAGKLVTGLAFGVYSQGEWDYLTERRVQLDPKTHTGWSFSSDGTQIQRFNY